MSGWWRARVLRTNLSQLPTLQAGELAYVDDQNQLWVGASSGNKLLIQGSSAVGPTGPAGLPGATGVAGATGIGNGEIAFSKLYQVPTTSYPTIQAAIDAAFNAGHTSNQNYAVVEVAPGFYNENLTLRPGVNLKGRSGNYDDTEIVGNVTYAAQINQPQNRNTIYITAMLIGGKLEVSGSNASSLILQNSGINQYNTSSTDPCLLLNNSSSQVNLTNSRLSHRSATANCINVLAGNLFINNSNISNNSSTTPITSPLIKFAGNFSFISKSTLGLNAFNNTIEIANASSQLFFENCQIQNNQNGGNCFLFSASGSISVWGSELANNFGNINGTGKIAVTTSGGGNIYFGTNTISGNNGTDPLINLISFPDRLRYDNWKSVLYVGGKNGFKTFTDALNYATSKGLDYIQILAEPGSYVEDINVPDINVQFYANTAGITNFAQVSIDGQINLTPTVANTITFQGFRINAGIGKNCLNYQTNIFTFPSFRYCEFVKSGDNLPAIFIKAPYAGQFHSCDIQVFSDTVHSPAIDLEGQNLIIKGLNLIGQNDISGGSNLVDNTFSRPIIKLRNNSQAAFFNVQFSNGFAGGTFIELNNNCDISFYNSKVVAAIQFGQIFYYKGNNSTVRSYNTNFEIGGNPILPELSIGSAAALARDGNTASGTVTLTANTFNPGDKITIAGTNITVNVDFAVGATTQDTARNIATAINSNIALSQKVYAISNNTSVISIYSYKFNAAGNAITLTKVGASFTISGATLSGGVTGSGNFFFRSASTFDGFASYSQNTISDIALPQAPTLF